MSDGGRYLDNVAMLPGAVLWRGDCLDVMRALDPESVDAVVTDPPYGIRFMGKAWDGADIVERHGRRMSAESADPSAGIRGAHKSRAAHAGLNDLSPAGMRAFQEFSRAWAAEALRVLKPGGHLLSFASPRTYHRMASGIEDAGFEIRDQIMWVFGSGFPKSHNGEWGGTALKPAHEPIVVARKPLAGTVAANHAVHGVGGLAIGACRIPGAKPSTTRGAGGGNGIYSPLGAQGRIEDDGLGRWPANLIHDGSEEVVAAFPHAPGQQGTIRGTEPSAKTSNTFGEYAGRSLSAPRGDTGSAARFFYCAKVSKADRGAGNDHPTVKPTDLMAYLCRLVTPAGGLVLDPFTGSGSTGKAAVREGFKFIGAELEPSYFRIARSRILEEATRVRT